ncbi:MAG: hypothetical protein Q7N87_02450 [Candidatus Uhrbacteria bacterium]|nr:hypothetical protein [Candidatus Uhrbacteria bacterium]
MAIPPNGTTMILIPWRTMPVNAMNLIEDFIANPHLNPQQMLMRDRKIGNSFVDPPGIIIVISHEAPANLLIEFLNHLGHGSPVTIKPFTNQGAYRLRYPER